MKSYSEQEQIIMRYHELGQTLAATHFLIDLYQLEHPNLEGFSLRGAAKPDFVLLTTEGPMQGKQTIHIPENLYEFPLNLVLNLLAHEMVHVSQKTKEHAVTDRNEREWQAYYENLFHKLYPAIPPLSKFHQIQFAKKAFEYYARMVENSALQQKYATQKKEVENLLTSFF